DTDRINDLNFAAGDQILLARFGNGTLGGGAKSSLPTGLNVNGLGSDYVVISSVGDLVSLINNSAHVNASKYGSNDLSIAISDTNGDVETLQLADQYSAYIAAGGRIGSSGVTTVQSSVSQSGALVTNVQVTSDSQVTPNGLQLASRSPSGSGSTIGVSPISLRSNTEPLSSNTNLGVTFTSAGGVTSLAFALTYDPALVTIKGA